MRGRSNDRGGGASLLPGEPGRHIPPQLDTPKPTRKGGDLREATHMRWSLSCLRSVPGRIRKLSSPQWISPFRNVLW